MKEKNIKSIDEIVEEEKPDLKEILSLLKSYNYNNYTDLEIENIIDDWKRDIVNNRD